MKLVITGANGFIGRHLMPLTPDAIPLTRDDFKQTDKELISHCTGADALVHLAGRAHKHENAAGVAPMYHAENVLLTRRVLGVAKAAGVTHFIFLSTAGVHGVKTDGKPFSELSHFRPETLYAESKVRAETEVIEFCTENNISWTILRPGLVYGEDMPGHLGTLQKMMRLHIPIPYGATRNKRSLISVENLCDAILFCTTSKHARNQVYLLSDGIDRSSASLMRHLAKRQDSSLFMLPIPVPMLRAAAAMLGLTHRFISLWTDFEMDTTKSHAQLGWHPK